MRKLKKIVTIILSVLLVLTVTGCDKKDEKKETEKEQVNNGEKETENVKEECTPKKFSKKYKYFYATAEECDKESKSTAFFDIVDNVDSRVFTVNCDKIVDDCGTTWYGVSYNIYDPDNSTRDDGVVVVYY